jgi:hypothetical protein
LGLVALRYVIDMYKLRYQSTLGKILCPILAIHSPDSEVDMCPKLSQSELFLGFLPCTPFNPPKFL